MPRLLIPLIIVALGITIYALIEAIGTSRDKARILPKPVWILVILLIPPIGGILWLIFGHKRSFKSSPKSFDLPSFPQSLGDIPFPGSRTSRSQPATTQKSPDDDDEFLRQLDIQRQQKARAAELDAREARLRAMEQRMKQEHKKNDQDSNGEIGDEKSGGSAHQD